MMTMLHSPWNAPQSWHVSPTHDWNQHTNIQNQWTPSPNQWHMLHLEVHLTLYQGIFLLLKKASINHISHVLVLRIISISIPTIDSGILTQELHII